VINGRTFEPHDVKRITINEMSEISTELLPSIRARREASSVRAAIADEWYVTNEGRDVTNELIREPAGHIAASRARHEAADRRSVMVVHGRDLVYRDAMFEFLRALDLRPLEWTSLVASTGKGSPYTGEVLQGAFAQAQAVVVLFTPDDEARLQERLWTPGEDEAEKTFMGQPRPNVLFEAGMAFGTHPDRTIIVEIGSRLRAFSDIFGRHAVRLDGSAERLRDLASRLKTAGCEINDSGADWLDASRFSIPPETDVQCPVDPGSSREKTEAPAEMYELLKGYAEPAFRAAASLLNQARDGLQVSPDLARRDLAGPVQRAHDDGARAFSLAWNAILHEDGADPDAALADFHRQYQGMTTWIERGFAHSVLSADTVSYRLWYEADENWLRKLRETAARPKRKILYESVHAAGWGEGVRMRLPAPASRPPA
jgi:predicted nucleotide-binding protein